MLRRAFSMFDSAKSGKIEREKVRLILNTLGYTYDDGELDGLVEAEDTEGKLSDLRKEKNAQSIMRELPIKKKEENLRWRKIHIDLALES